MMSCEEFERVGLDLDRPDASAEGAALAAEHAQRCQRCSALLASWRALKADLRLLRETTQRECVPARVEMRLKQELQTRREARVPRGAVAVAAWALAAVAVLAVGASWKHWRDGISPNASIRRASPVPPAMQDGASAGNSAVLLAAEYDAGSFTQLPDSMPSASSDASVLQVRMQRGALLQFGLPVEPERASEWVNVDFLVGEDGQPVAVRLHQDSQGAAILQ